MYTDIYITEKKQIFKKKKTSLKESPDSFQCAVHTHLLPLSCGKFGFISAISRSASRPITPSN